jgi:hypothetical protein
MCVAMGIAIPVGLAEFMAIKGLAAIAFGLIAYLYWLGFREKRALRRQRREAEQRRRTRDAAVAKK